MGHFLPFYPPKSPKNQNFEKMKKTPRDIIILYMCTKNYDQIMYGSSNMVRDRCNYFFILGHFLSFYPSNSPKNQNFEKLKKALGTIIILHMCTKNYDQMMYSSWDMVRDRCNCYFSFLAIFCPFTPLTAQKIKILKKWKKFLKTSSFYICVPKIKIRWCTVPEICCAVDRRTDGRQTDGKSDI